MKIGNAGSVNPYDSIIIKDSDKLHEKFAEHMQEIFDKLLNDYIESIKNIAGKE